MGDPWGIGGFRGGGGEAQREREHILKKIGEIGIKSENFSDIFLLEMVYLALEPPLKWDLFRLMDCEKNH